MLKYRLGIRFIIIVGAFVAAFMMLILYVSWHQNNVQTQMLMDKQSRLAMEFDLAIRDYVAQEVRPFAQECVGSDEFVPETMSTSFVARNIFEKVQSHFPDYVLKFSSKNPRNPKNLAGPEELAVIERFENDPNLNRWSGEIEIDGRSHIALFRARRLEKSCLGCHGDPESAPASLVSRYGNIAGFHQEVGDVIALDTVAIPVSSYRQEAFVAMMDGWQLLALGLVFVLLATFIAFRSLVNKKLSFITNHFQKFVTGENPRISPIQYSGKDEVGDLVCAFNTLAIKLQNSTISVERLNAEIEQRSNAEEALAAMNKKLEETLRQMTWSNHQMKEFIHLTAHDLQTPLRGVGMLATWLTMDLGGALDEESREKLHLLTERATRISKMLDAIRLYAGIERDPSVERRLDSTVVIGDALRLIKLRDEVEIDIQPDMPHVYCHEEHFRLLFASLIENGIRFVDKEQGVVTVSAQMEDEHITFLVNDNGCGIEEKYHDQIFGVFKRLTSEEYDSSIGIGLSLVRKIVELYGGTIDLDSTPGVGTTFYVKFPKIMVASSGLRMQDVSAKK